MTSTDGHPEELLFETEARENKIRKPRCSEALPSPSSWTAWGVGEGAGTYTGSVGGSLIHLEAHFEILEFFFISILFILLD